MSVVNKYRFHCVTENAVKDVWDVEPPTKCPVDTAHTIDASSMRIVGTRGDNMVKIQEESTPTGGNFTIKSLKFECPANSESHAYMTWPYPITVLSFDYTAQERHVDDLISIIVGENTIVGALAGMCLPATPFTSPQTYTVGQMVTFTHPNPLFGERTYTCIADTTENQTPLDTTYWKHGCRVPVTSTVLQHATVGIELNLFDGPQSNDLGEVIARDPENSIVYTKNSPTSIFSPLSPTYVRVTEFNCKDLQVVRAWNYVLGESKIGGSYVPANVIIKVVYKNLSPTEDKDFGGYIEYLR